MPVISCGIRWREFVCAGCGSVLLAFSTMAFGAPPGNRDAQQKSLDEALLEDLDAGLPKPAAKKPPAPQQPAAQKSAKKVQPPSADETHPTETPKKTLDDELLEGLEGEDVSLGNNPADENPLVRLNARMKQVERRIAEAHSDQKTQRLQEEISDDLAKLIAQLEQQCSQCKNPSSSGSQKQQTSQSKPAIKPGDQPAEKPARESSPNVKERETAKVDVARLQEMLKDVWGHLPAHLRQQMEQSANEEFLPKYETEISQYYRSLVGGRKEKK
ncbi:MAG TPA: hypothetical protein VHC22_15995 [Pirellulales bacterium]|nr:hypothetical protein [Pirellulales bacterium]